MTLASEMAADLVDAEADITQTVTIGGTAYACVAGEVGHQDDMADIAGYTDNRSVRITVRQSLFTTMPKQGDLVTHDGTSWRIVKIEKDPSGLDVAVNLICEETTA